MALELPTTEFPQAPVIQGMQPANAGNANPSPPPGGIGYANRGVQATDAFVEALKGIQAAHAKKSMQQFNQVQQSAMVAKMKYDAAVSHLQAYQQAVADKTMQSNDPRIAAAKQAAQDADTELAGRTQKLGDLIAGGKAGGKNKPQDGQLDHRGNLDKALYKAAHTVSSIGTALSGNPKPLAPIQKSTPPLVPATPTGLDPTAG